MSYPASMEESKRKVEETRPKRLEKGPADRIPAEERNALVSEFHPDFIKNQFRELRIGANKSEAAPLEIADLLEGNSRIDPDRIDLDKIDHDADVLVIGCGGAGGAASLLAEENGASVLISSKLRLGDANTIGAQAGTQACDRPNDSPAIHYLDIMG